MLGGAGTRLDMLREGGTSSSEQMPWDSEKHGAGDSNGKDNLQTFERPVPDSPKSEVIQVA